MSAIYEVTVEVDSDIAAEFLIWLKRHITDIVNEAGFSNAQVFAIDSKAGTRSWVTHYHAGNRSVIDSYIEHLAPKFRADAVERFAERVRVQRRILEQVPDLTVPSEKSQIGCHNRKDESMSTQASWNKIRNEFTRLTDVEQLKSEVHRIGNELRKFDFHAVLSPSAQARVKMFERRYAELMRTMQTAQRQVDREFNKILRQIKTRRSTVTKVMSEQRDKLNTLRRRFTAGSAKMKKSAGKRATSKSRTSGKKRRK